MTLDETIRHCEEVAAEKEDNARWKLTPTFQDECIQCAADHRQLAEWLTELKEAKRLLKAAVEIINAVDCNEDYLCDECEYRAKCDGGFSFYWRYTDEALKLIGGETDEHS